MKVYFAGIITSPELFNIKESNYGVLRSYIELRNKKIFPSNHDKLLLLDSGAFSVASGKTKVDIYKYIDFIKKYKNKINIYANLDVLGDAIKTNDNQLLMEGEGLLPLPTFHYGSDYYYLEKMAEKYSYIGLGALVPLVNQKQKLFDHLNTCFSIINKKNIKLKIHAWGMTSKDILLSFPFYSCDSTSWLAGGRFRRKFNFKYFNFISIQGAPINYLIGYHDINISNAKHILFLVDTITKIWEKRGIKWD